MSSADEIAFIHDLANQFSIAKRRLENILNVVTEERIKMDAEKAYNAILKAIALTTEQRAKLGVKLPPVS